jgi:hypothetical protein
MPKKKTNDVKAEIKKITKKKKRKVYFGQEVQDAVVEYNSSTNDEERNKIYGTRIHAAFDKLAENIINTFKFTYFDYGFEDIKHEVVAFMVMNMHKYDHTKGSKAFSYFSVVAKNYLILHNNNNYKKLKSHDKMDALDRQYKSSGFNESDYAILTDEIENFNKKALYILIREMTNVETAHITSVVNVFKKHYKKLLNTFNKDGTIIHDSSGSFF